MIDRIIRSYTTSAYEVDTSTYNAGLGIFTVLHAGGSIFYLVTPETSTEATVFYRKTPNLREFRDQFRFFSLRSRRPVIPGGKPAES
jgi:hypothetical protein